MHHMRNVTRCSVKNFIKHSRKESSGSPYLKANYGSILTNSKAKANLLNLHFDSIFSPLGTPFQHAQHSSNYPCMPPIETVDGMQQALRSLKSGKAPGPDSIHPEFLMHLGTECQNSLRMFMTNCMQRTKIPKSWRRTKIIAILKPGKSPEEAGSYRPISLLSVCFKLLERLIYNRLLPVVDPQLPREQAGFRPGRSTVEQVVKRTEDIETAFENRKKCGAVFVDLSAAYDTVWYRRLALKMLQLIQNKHMVRFIRELITNRSFKLYVGKDSSNTYTIKNGVPQGSVLAPMRSNIYV